MKLQEMGAEVERPLGLVGLQVEVGAEVERPLGLVGLQLEEAQLVPDPMTDQVP